jgi:Shikimate dehydrogenase substrate binding domain
MPEQQTFLSMITGSFSTPAAENPTVAMIEAAYEHHHIDARYLNCDVAPDALGDAVRGARAMGWVGFNCSMPHKVSVIKYLDGLGSSAALIGAVNCVVRRDNRYIGENTDGQGFLTALRTIADPAGKVFVLFGAGGAARAIAVELALAGAASITIVNRDPRRGLELVALLNEKTPARADSCGLGSGLSHPRDKRYRRECNLDRTFPSCGRSARSRFGQPASWSGGCRRHPQSAANTADPGCGSTRFRCSRRPWHVGQPGCNRYPVLDWNRT